MTTHQDKEKPINDYQIAETMIDQAIATMEEETHIEYASTIMHSVKPARRKWYRKLIDKLLRKI